MLQQGQGGDFRAQEHDLIAASRQFADGIVAPAAERWELERRMPRTVFQEAARAGLAGVLVPRDQGGAELSFRAACEVVGTLAAADFACTFALWVNANIANGLARNGTAAQIDGYLPGLLAGDCVGAFCLTEPGAGSDATAVATRALKADGGWRLEGTKSWVTNGTEADVFVVYAQTDPDAGWRGIAAFLIERGDPGLAVSAPYTMLGGHAMGIADITLDGVLVPEDRRLFDAGEGFKAAMSGINMARVFVAAACCGMLADSLSRALAFGAERTAFGKPVVAFQGLQWELADVATELEAARLLAAAAARALDAGDDGVLEAAHAKKFATRAAMGGISTCMRAMGGIGFRTMHPLARHLAAAKMTEYLDGTTEIQNVVISRALLEPYGIKAR